MGGFGASFSAGVRAVQNPQAAEQDRQNLLQSKVAPLSQALQADQIRLAAFTDPKTGHAIPEHEQEYEHVMANMQNTIGQMRTLLGEKQPTAGVLDRLHIRRDLQHRVQNWQDQNKQTAASYAEGALPYEQTPEGQKETVRHKNTIEEIEARNAATGWSKIGSPVQVGGKWYQPFSDKAGETKMEPMPEGYKGPQTKPVKGPLVKSKQSPTGFAQVYLDPQDPNRVVAWQPVTPSRYYTGTTTSSTSTDPFGVTTTSNRSTQPMLGGEVDLSGAQKMDAEPEPPGSTPSAPSAAPPFEGPKTKAVKAARGAAPAAKGPKVLDENGHIPANAANPYLVQGANDLLDGKAQKDLQIPAKDKQAAAALAAEYGYLGEGMFTPRERMQVDQSQQLMDSLRRDKEAMSVFDEGPIKRALIQTAIDKAKTHGLTANISRAIINTGLNEKDVMFVQDYLQLIGRVQALAQLTRGTGRPTEAAVNRMMQELPNVLTAKNQKEAQHAFDLIQDEINIGMGKRKGGPKTDKLRETQKNGADSDPLGVL
jgi:hypothetical protein